MKVWLVIRHSSHPYLQISLDWFFDTENILTIQVLWDTTLWPIVGSTAVRISNLESRFTKKKNAVPCIVSQPVCCIRISDKLTKAVRCEKISEHSFGGNLLGLLDLECTCNIAVRVCSEPYCNMACKLKMIKYITVNVGNNVRNVRGAPGGGCRATSLQTPQNNRNLKKNTDFVDTVISRFYVIHPSTEISHWNQLMTSTLEFLIIN